MPNCYSNKFICSSSLMILLGFATLSVSPAQAQTVACEPPVVVNSAPPPLPVYEQPPLPGPGYVWTPGYWSWSDDDEDYYWVPGTWVEPPRPGLLWTPGYWGWAGGSYLFHHGYWGTRVGYYGGIHYGHGYTGEGYEGGRWRNGHFFYNRSVTNITTKNITNVYEKTVNVNRNVNRVSFNGGAGGTQVHPTKEQRAFSRQQHFAATPVQHKNVTAASKDKALSNKTNHGRPPVAATAHPAQFKGTGVVPSRHEGEANPANGAHPESTKPGMTKPEGAKPGTMKPEGHGHGMTTPENGRHGMPNSQNGRHEQSGQHDTTKPGEKTAPGNQPGKPAMTPEHRGAHESHPGANEKMLHGPGAAGENKPAATSHEKPGMRGGRMEPGMKPEHAPAPAGHAGPQHAHPTPERGGPEHRQPPMQMQHHQAPAQMQHHQAPQMQHQAPMQMQHRQAPPQMQHQAPAQMQRHEPNHPAAAPHNGGEHGRPQAHGPANAHPNQGGGHHGPQKQDEKR